MENSMITLQDCIAFSGLDPEAIEALAAHHSFPHIIATQYAAARMQTEDGAEAIAVIVRHSNSGMH